MVKRLSIPSILVLLVFLFLPMLSFAWNVPDTGQTRKFLLNGFGEDSDYTIHPPSYTKLDASGSELPDTATEWAMVRDNVTGLVWENKVDDPNSIHHFDTTYSWAQTSRDFIAALNASRFGGFSDWRLPTLKELSSIVDNSVSDPAINAFYFPHTAISIYGNYRYWTSTTYLWDYVWAVNFRDGLYGTSMRNYDWNWARAVRGGRPDNPNRFIDSTEPGHGGYTWEVITDTATGLMWQKQGPTSAMSWESAIAYCESYGLSVQRPDGTWVYYQDWRLPTWKELQSIAQYGNLYSPAIDTEFFKGSYSSYWSSTHDVHNRGPLTIGFSSGALFIRSHLQSSYVRCVRGGQRGPSGDSDGDGIYDDGDESGIAGDNYCTGVDMVLCDDNCPNKKNPDQADANNNGIGDACDTVVDSDGDGVPDDLDGCPADPQKANPGTCGCGVADTDSDGDGTPDCIDACPADPGKVQPGVCGCGVSDVDSDGDGKQDCIDSCPNSIRGATISIGSSSTGVINRLSGDGCTMSDLIARCAAGAKNHGAFVSCVAHLTDEWKSNGVITGKEKGDIQSCAAKAP